jgi:hypothetical protein
MEEGKATPPKSNDVQPKNTASNKSAEPPNNPSPPPKTTPPPERHGKREHCRPDQTPWYKMILEAVVVFAGLYVAWIYSGQLNQMIESNRISRESLEVVEGAIVSFSPPVKPVPISYSSDKKSKKVDAWQLMVPINNDGGTPTRDAKVYWTALLRKDPLPNDFDFPDAGDGIAGPVALGPKHTLYTLPIAVGALDIKAVGDRTEHLYVYGWATYRDRFRLTPSRLTQFCYELSEVAGDPLTAGGMEAIRFSLCKAHNCYDEECTDYNARTK